MADYTDSFDRGDSSDLGADWTPVTGQGSFGILTNEAQVTNNLVDSEEIYVAGAFTDDQYSAAVIGVGGVSGTGDQTGIGVLVRGTTAAKTFYWAVVNAAGSNNVSVHKIITGSASLLAQRTQAFAAGDTLRLEVTGQGASTVLKVFRNGVQLGADIADSTGSHIASGSAGLAYSGDVGTNLELASWAGGDLGAAASQLLNPSADSVDGTWTNEADGTTLAASIDEDTASDTDYIQSVLSPSTSGCRIKLETGGDPASSTDHVIRWRGRKDATGGQTIGLTVKLYQGGGNSQGAGTLIASFTRANVSNTFTDFTETLSGGEADSITNYGDLYLEFFANAT